VQQATTPVPTPLPTAVGLVFSSQSVLLPFAAVMQAMSQS
jgi:hypothetical protein